MLLELESERGSAIFSQDKVHRYWLTRNLAPDGITVAYGMLNPSDATHEDNDPTIGRCVGFASRPGMAAKRMIVVNLFGLVSPYPKDLLVADDPVGTENESFIRRAIREADLFIVAWGALSKPLRIKSWVMRRVLQEGLKAPKCLGTTKDGSPCHPLYLAGTTPLVDWHAANP